MEGGKTVKKDGFIKYIFKNSQKWHIDVVGSVAEGRRHYDEELTLRHGARALIGFINLWGSPRDILKINKEARWVMIVNKDTQSIIRGVGGHIFIINVHIKY